MLNSEGKWGKQGSKFAFTMLKILYFKGLTLAFIDFFRYLKYMDIFENDELNLRLPCCNPYLNQEFTCKAE